MVEEKSVMVKEGPAIEEVLTNLYRVEIPIPNNPLKALNSYVVKGAERNLIIDTGVNHREAVDAMFSCQKTLDVDLNKTDLFVTHLHVDHLGLVKKLATESSKVYFSQYEAVCVNSDKMWQELNSWEDYYHLYSRHGFPKAGLAKTIKSYPGYAYATGKDVEVVAMSEGNVINVGDYCFRGIETPGHTPGHMCLYEDAKKVLVSGDHILFDVTPNVALWREIDNPLENYLASLDRLIPLEVGRVLPAHKRVFSDHRKRIEEIKHHHEDRLSEILVILEKGEQDAYQIVSQVSWRTEGVTWDRLPYLHKFASFGEVLAHLKYLERDGRICRIEKHEKVAYSLNGCHEV